MAKKKKQSLRDRLPYSEVMIDLIEQFSILPGIGEKSAEKLAYHILTQPKEEALKLSKAIEQVKNKMNYCEDCFNLTEESPCEICRDDSRDKTLICVVEQPKDLWALEKAGNFKGLYHILTGRLDPLAGITAEQLTIRQLINRVKKSLKSESQIREIIVATNPDFEGDGTMLAVKEALKNYPVKLSRIARGIPIGGSIEMASPGMLSEALKDRQKL